MFVQRREDEPRYNGVPLSDCLRATVRAQGWNDEQSVNGAAQIDTAAIPYLLKWMHYEPGDLRLNLAYRIGRWRPRSAFGPLAKWIQRNDREELAHATTTVFLLLGSDADSASDELGLMLNDASAPETAHRAMIALEAIGTTNSLGKLISVFAEPSTPLSPNGP
jgi:hypothetical protein